MDAAERELLALATSERMAENLSKIVEIQSRQLDEVLTRERRQECRCPRGVWLRELVVMLAAAAIFLGAVAVSSKLLLWIASGIRQGLGRRGFVRRSQMRSEARPLKLNA
ncbi:hypothetical protein [Burkholderia sp. PAMC 28687]|uniref:hypothetical protein n=1 Tax=Burkholderia sp. PAMC 28687 TaxID=1795874 RepID=UPI000AA50247|nr:hypothetical protein [Burkholderia sp. PAMC 28687]